MQHWHRRPPSRLKSRKSVVGAREYRGSDSRLWRRVLRGLSLLVIPALLGACGNRDTAVRQNAPSSLAQDCSTGQAQSAAMPIASPGNMATPTVDVTQILTPQVPPTAEERELRGLVIDFIASIFGDELKARNYLAPEYRLSIPDLRQTLGLQCTPTTFSVTRSRVQGMQGTVCSALRYSSHTTFLEVDLELRSQRWLITRVVGTQAPQPNPSSIVPSRCVE